MKNPQLKLKIEKAKALYEIIKEEDEPELELLMELEYLLGELEVAGCEIEEGEHLSVSIAN